MTVSLTPRIRRELLIAEFTAWLGGVNGRLTALEQPDQAPQRDGRRAVDEEFSMAVSADDIRAAYRILLNREPDTGGLAYYRSRADNKAYRLRDLLDDLSQSGERML